jgi:DNA-nicking Smr family endonuclease
MEGVRPLPEEERVPPPRPPPATRRPAAEEEESEALARLADLCAGIGPFGWSDTSEYIEGGAPGVDRRLVRRLRRGEFSVQAHLDLHGMTRDEARRAVEHFVTTARQRGLRCVLVIHGRGLNSKDQIPVLKQRLAAWLQRGKLGRQVLAFATARPSDGGAGAIYVLLRK